MVFFICFANDFLNSFYSTDTPRNNEFAPPSFDSGGVEDVFKAPMAPPPSTANANKQCDKSIADILKNPSKVAVLRVRVFFILVVNIFFE